MLKVKKENELEIDTERKQEESSPLPPRRHRNKSPHILVKQIQKSCSRFLASSLSPSSPSSPSACSWNASPRSSSTKHGLCHAHTPPAAATAAFSRTPFTMHRSSSSPSPSSKASVHISSAATNINAYKDDSVAECIKFMKKSACSTT